MSNSGYAIDVEKFWPNNEIIAELKKVVVIDVRDKKFGKADALRSKMGQEIYPYFDEVDVDLNPKRSHLIRDKNYKDFLQDVLNGVKPIKDPKAISPPKGRDICAVLLAWLSDCHPEYAVEFLDLANAKLVQLGAPEKRILFRAFQPLELRADEDIADFSSVGRELTQKEAPNLSIHEGEASLTVPNLVTVLGTDEENYQPSITIENEDTISDSESVEIFRVLNDFEPVQTSRLPIVEEISEVTNAGSVKHQNTDSIENEIEDGHAQEIARPWIFDDWQSEGITSSPKVGEDWKEIHTWSPARTRSFWMGFRALLFGLPSTKSYEYSTAIWTGDSIRAVATARLVYPVLMSFSLDQPRGKILLARQKRDNFKPQLAAAKGSSKAFLFSDRLGWMFVKDVSNETVAYFKPACGEIAFAGDASRHPFDALKLGGSAGGGYHEEPAFVAFGANEKTILFSHYTRGPKSYFKRAVDVYRVEGDDFLKVDEWEHSLHSLCDLTPHPSISGRFFRSPNRAVQVGEKTVETTTKSNWHVASGTRTLAWHSTMPLIIVTSYLNAEEKRHSIHLIDTESGECLMERIASNAIESVGWSPDGRYVFFSTRDHALTRWDLKTDEIRKIFSNNTPVTKIEVSPRGYRVALQNWGDPRRIGIFDVESFDKLTEFDGTFENFNGTPWHYEGRDIAYVSDHQICVRRLQAKL